MGRIVRSRTIWDMPGRGRSSVFLEVFALSQAVRDLLLTTMVGGPLTPTEYAFYSVVFEAEAVTPTEMARQLSVPKTTVMEYVRLMEERSHTRRITNPRDGRSYRLTLTASGLTAHRQAHDRFEVAYRAFLTAFAGDEGKAQARLQQLRPAVVAAATRGSALAPPRRAARV